MYTGFNLRLDKNAELFGDSKEYVVYEFLGKKHLSRQKASFEKTIGNLCC